MPFAAPPSPDAPAPAPYPEAVQGAPACEACGGPLTVVQVAKGAHACSPACRARAHRAARKARRLAEVDAAIKVLVELRGEIARG